MTRLREPSLGPIVGHTTPTSCKLLVRGANVGEDGATLRHESRTIGIASLVERNGSSIPHNQRPTYYFRLHREFDRTGTFRFGVDHNFQEGRRPDEIAARSCALTPDTDYRFRLGSLSLDDAFPNDAIVKTSELAKRLPPPQAWLPELDRLDANRCEASVRTFPASSDTPDRLSFILACCRHSSLEWRRKRADRIFEPMRMETENSEDPARFVLMVGDQLYAEAFQPGVPFSPTRALETFHHRYVEAFGSPQIRALLRSAPHYMFLDNCGISSGSPTRWTGQEQHLLFKIAIEAYRNYQWSHGPRTYKDRHYYQFDCGGYPFFVLDGRTQRYKSADPDGIEENCLLGRSAPVGPYRAQIDTVCNWLIGQQRQRGNRPKFLVMASPFVPNPVSSLNNDRSRHESDSWAAFPSTRRRLLGTIVKNKIQNVVFLSGETSCSNVARLEFSGSASAERLRATSISASAFHSPFPFADGEPSDFVHDSTHPKTPDSFRIHNKAVLDYRAEAFTQKDSYCQILVDRKTQSLTVRTKDRHGEVITENGRLLETVMELAEW